MCNLKDNSLLQEMCLQLQLSFLTNGEKHDIMTCPPLNDKLREIRQDILQKRGNNVSQPFLHEIESLIKSRDKGYRGQATKVCATDGQAHNDSDAV